jgi:hypothetical protein
MQGISDFKIDALIRITDPEYPRLTRGIDYRLVLGSAVGGEKVEPANHKWMKRAI